MSEEFAAYWLFPVIGIAVAAAIFALALANLTREA